MGRPKKPTKQSVVREFLDTMLDPANELGHYHFINNRTKVLYRIKMQKVTWTLEAHVGRLGWRRRAGGYFGANNCIDQLTFNIELFS